MAKDAVYLVLKGQAHIGGSLHKSDFLVLEGVCASGITAEQVEKQLQIGNLKLMAVKPKPESAKQDEKGESGA